MESPSNPPRSSFLGSLESDPEYLAAVEQERWVRQVSFSSLKDNLHLEDYLTETISGFECVPMTLNHLLLFQIAENPIFSGAIPSANDLAQFFWILSPHYSRTAKWKKWITYHQCGIQFKQPRKPCFKFLINTWAAECARRILNFQEAVGGARRFIEETFQDSERGSGGARDVEFFCDAAWICAAFGREYGWPVHKTMNMPLKQIFQFLREIRHHHLGKKAGLANKSSELLHSN